MKLLTKDFDKSILERLEREQPKDVNIHSPYSYYTYN